jgi:hypothetical protein
MSADTRASFVVRVVRDRKGRISGVVERVTTGAKEPFSDTAAIGALILEMFGRESAPLPRGGPGPDEAALGGSTGCPTTP